MFQSHISIYVASKLRHAEKFLKFRETYPDIHFTARWPITAGLGSEADRPVYQWMQESEMEIANSNCVLVYAEPGEALKTGLIQVGMALSRRIPIFVVGDHVSYSTWQFWEGAVTRCPTLEKAMASIRIKFRGEPEKIGRTVTKGMRLS